MQQPPNDSHGSSNLALQFTGVARVPLIWLKSDHAAFQHKSCDSFISHRLKMTVLTKAHKDWLNLPHHYLPSDGPGSFLGGVTCCLPEFKISAIHMVCSFWPSLGLDGNVIFSPFFFFMDCILIYIPLIYIT